MTVVQASDNEVDYPFAYVTRTGRQGWRIVAKDHRYDSSVRFSVSHELAHVLLYQTDSGPDDEAWLKSEASELEEAICNYLGRYMLAPDEVLLPRLTSDGNAAAQVVAVLVAGFGLPLRHALLRWIDVSDRVGRRCDAALLWQQYHPFDPSFIKVSCRSCTEKVIQFLSGLAAGHRNPSLTFEQAILFWKHLLRQVRPSPSDNAAVELSLFASEDAAARRDLAALASTDSNLIAALERLALGDPVLTLRPEWFGMSNDLAGTFVPCKRGAAGAGTIVAALADGSTPECQSGAEAVRIGALAGSFFTDAYAWGNAAVGTRHVVQLLERR